MYFQFITINHIVYEEYSFNIFQVKCINTVNCICFISKLSFVRKTSCLIYLIKLYLLTLALC